MIYAIVGPDRSGKSTLFEALKGRIVANFVSSVPMRRELLPVIELIEERTVALWRSLYIPDYTYICDRCPFVDNIAYAMQYNRGPRDYSWWKAHVRCIYLRTTSDVLEQREQDALPQDYAKSLKCYDLAVSLYENVVLDAAKSTSQLAEEALEWIGRKSGRSVSMTRQKYAP